MSLTVYLNGKFTCQRMTGVQRVAEQLVRALDARPAGRRWVLLCPPGGGLTGLAQVEQRITGGPARPLHLWEQAVLPWAARGGLLLNLSGSAPWLARRQAALLHDAAVFDHPEAYTPAFVGWYRRLFRRLGRRAEALFTPSAFSRARLAACLGVPEARFTVLPNAVDHLDGVAADDGVLDRHGLRGARFVLAVASANPTKNIARLVEAYARLEMPDFGLVIVGGANARVFAGTHLPDDPPGVLRTGPLDDAPLRALYVHALALAFPSVYEGFGLPPLEAMSLGCPVAVARAAAMPEVCGDAALYFDPLSVQAIAAALQRIVHDEALRARLRTAGPARAAAWRWQDAAARLAEALPA